MGDSEEDDEVYIPYADLTIITPESTPRTAKKLAMFRPPDFVKRLNGHETALTGESATLTCHIEGFPKPIMTWFKDDDALIENTRVVLTEPETGSYVLTIDNCVKKDEAAYRCRAENTEGSASSCWYLAVKGKREKSRKRRSRSCSPKRSVSFPPLFSTILEKVDEEEKEGEEVEKQPESPLTKLYYGPKDRSKEWTQFVGEWAFKSDDDLDNSDSDDSEEEKIKREEKNNEKNMSSTTDNTASDDTEVYRENLSTDPAENVRETSNRAADFENKPISDGKGGAQIENPQVKLKIPRSVASHDIAKESEEKYGDEKGLTFTPTAPVFTDNKVPSRPKSTDRPITAPRLISHPVLPKNSKKDKAVSKTDPQTQITTSNKIEPLNEPASRLPDPSDQLQDVRTKPTFSSNGAGDGDSNVKSEAECFADDEQPESSQVLPPSLKPIKDKSKSKFSRKQKEKGVERKKRRRSLKSQRGSTGFLPSPEEIFLGLSALTFFCIYFNVSPVPFILLVLWAEISVCIFYGFIKNRSDDTES